MEKININEAANSGASVIQKIAKAVNELIDKIDGTAAPVTVINVNVPGLISNWQGFSLAFDYNRLRAVMGSVSWNVKFTSSTQGALEISGTGMGLAENSNNLMLAALWSGGSHILYVLLNENGLTGNIGFSNFPGDLSNLEAVITIPD